jgi:hypothetical protein
MIIKDEAHTASLIVLDKSRHQRYELVNALSKDPLRHLFW